ncbi:MAG TPA: GTPase ObgE [Syntrophorhabdaceae bacterium]|jgi:GTP-binding protein|nr:GTPase ObgE [Syntrophorhabdaceae bacterium]MDI9560854.1 GTPase ObgE [Pseudomonadota bacterium]OQC49254.1 MAG: GTPase Obg/CgtA [Deltaproteobacteria bacterium ADurb.Bin026]MBV6505291.1 GTPase Obg/CgtA [Syntrophorhabdaceae bacterium]HNQ63438.1 GTPase ObgE [Syntrophorhabdaceae bacterium]
MKFVDEAKIFIKAGNGGQGCVSFRRAKFIPKGGPDGGDGGKGGDIILVGKRGLSSLVELNYKKIYKAENGKNGSGNNRKGRNGKDIYISVPLGTIVYNLDNPIIPLYDVAEDEKGYVVARGGRGGRGNTRFATSTNRTPVQFDFGGEGEEMAVHLVLKLLADIGIVGLPNTGKSTLISKLTDAKPQIGDYPFTTLIPTLGVMTNNDKTFVVADIPGIIEGASKGKGLGLMFLKHIERTKMLLLLLDLSSTNLEDDYSTILNELGSFNEEIVNKDRVLALNKTDLVSDYRARKWKKHFMDIGERVVSISALTGRGIEALKDALHLKQDV